jgi:hypothetical protein
VGCHWLRIGLFERFLGGVPFATGCHRLRPPGSINAPSIRRKPPSWTSKSSLDQVLSQLHDLPNTARSTPTGPECHGGNPRLLDDRRRRRTSRSTWASSCADRRLKGTRSLPMWSEKAMAGERGGSRLAAAAVVVLAAATARTRVTRSPLIRAGTGTGRKEKWHGSGVCRTARWSSVGLPDGDADPRWEVWEAVRLSAAERRCHGRA